MRLVFSRDHWDTTMKTDQGRSRKQTDWEAAT